MRLEFERGNLKITSLHKAKTAKQGDMAHNHNVVDNYHMIGEKFNKCEQMTTNIIYSRFMGCSPL